MGMSTHVIGIVLADEKFNKMADIWRACTAAGVAIPDEVSKFFDHKEPDPAGLTISLKHHECLSQPEINDCSDGWEVDLTKLPPHVAKIRFVNSY